MKINLDKYFTKQNLEDSGDDKVDYVPENYVDPTIKLKLESKVR